MRHGSTPGPKPGRKAQSRRSPANSGKLWAGYTVPPWFSDDAKREFWRLAGALKAVGTLNSTYPGLVELAATTAVLLQDAHAVVQREGLVLESSNHTKMPHPLLGTTNALTGKLAKLYADFGLTAATAKYGTAPADPAIAERWAGIIGVVGD